VQAPLQRLNLSGLSEYALSAKTNEQGEKCFVLRTILESFKGVSITFDRLTFQSDKSMPDTLLDFEWACSETLRSFKLSRIEILQTSMLATIIRRLSVMPKLLKVDMSDLGTVNTAAPSEKKSGLYNMFKASRRGS